MDIYKSLYSIDPRLAWPGPLFLLFTLIAAVTVKAVPVGVGAEQLPKLTRWAIGIMLAIVVGEFVIAGKYLFYPGYIDHAEAHVAAVSWLGWEGYPLYPSFEAGDIYGIPYGPFLYQLNGIVLWLVGPSIGTSKFTGILAFAITQVLSLVALRRTGASVGEAVTMTGAQCVLSAAFTDQAYVFGVRSDVLIFLIAQVAVLVAIARPTLLGIAIVGLLGGLEMNLKIHGALYVFPAFIWCLGRAPSLAAGMRLAAVGVFAGLLGVVLPFLPTNVSVVQYFHYFKVGANHPWLRWQLQENLLFAAMCLLPLGWIYLSFRPALPRAFFGFMAALTASIALISFPASAAGAGPHHFLPFLPSLFWALQVMRRAASEKLPDRPTRWRYDRVSFGLVVALLLGYGPIVFSSWFFALNRFKDAPLVNAAIAEINKSLAENPGLKIAVGPGEASFDAERLRVIPVFRGNPLPFDSSAWDGLRGDGISEEPLRRKIGQCPVDLWLLPANAPFLTRSLYSGERIYSTDLLREFHANFELQHSGQIFDQWRCNHGSSERKQK